MGAVLRGLDWTRLLDVLLSVIPALICITLHELAHGLVAYAMGDDTAKRAGRLTLNPLRSVDPMGLLMLAVFHFGWAKPVPVNASRSKNPRLFMAVTALAGPACNILITCVFLFLYGLCFSALQGSLLGGYALRILSLTAYISVGYAVFNMIPLPPLDGSKVLFALLPKKAYFSLMRYERYGVPLLLILSLTGVTSSLISGAMEGVFDFLFPIAEFAFSLV